MARYLNVVVVRELGRRLEQGAVACADHPLVPEGDRLVAVVHNGEWQSAVDVTYPAALERLRRRCAEGIWREMELYLLDEERARESEDGRRFLMSGLPV